MIHDHICTECRFDNILVTEIQEDGIEVKYYWKGIKANNWKEDLEGFKAWIEFAKDNEIPVVLETPGTTPVVEEIRMIKSWLTDKEKETI